MVSYSTVLMAISKVRLRQLLPEGFSLYLRPADPFPALPLSPNIGQVESDSLR